MEKIDFKKIRQLPPDEKIKVLKKIENKIRTLINQRKKEIQTKEKEINEAEELLSEAQEEFRVLEEIKKPEEKPVEIEKLFRPEKKEKDLEQIAAKTKTEQEQWETIQELSRQPINQLYSAVVGIKKEVSQTGIETKYQQEKMQQIGAAIYEKRKAADKREYNPGKKERRLMTKAEQIMENYL